MSTSPRVLQVLVSDRIGGAETLAASLEQNWSSSFVCKTAYLDLRSTSTGRIGRAVRLRRQIRNFKPTLIVAHTALPMIYSRFTAPLHVPIIDVIHSSGDDYAPRLLRFIERWSSRRSAVGIAVSSVASEKYAKRLPRRELRIIENGVQRPLGVRRSTGVDRSDQPKEVVTVARVALEKRPEFWAEVASLCSSQELKFVWWGPWDHDSVAADFVREHKASGNPGVFQGPTHEIGAVLSSADVLFHPSSREAQGVALIEAILSNVPVVCTKDIGAALGDELVAASFSEEDGPGGAVAAIQAVAADIDRVRLASAARARHAESVYGIARCAEEYRDVFEKIILGKYRQP